MVGLAERDSGKTTLARAILSFLNGREKSACGFKPRAGNSLWYDFDIVSKSLSEGRLYGSDARLLREASGNRFPEEVHSPVHRLWSVSSSYLPEPAVHLPGFVVDRLTAGGGSRTAAVVNTTRHHPLIADGLLRRFLGSCHEVYEVGTHSELAARTPLYDAAVIAAHDELDRRCETTVHESYADVALPWAGIRSLDSVLAVEPGRIRIYDSSRYLKACELGSGIRGEEVSARKVCRLVREEKAIALPPRRTEEILPCLIERVSELLV